MGSPAVSPATVIKQHYDSGIAAAKRNDLTTAIAEFKAAADSGETSTMPVAGSTILGVSSVPVVADEFARKSAYNLAQLSFAQGNTSLQRLQAAVSAHQAIAPTNPDYVAARSNFATAYKYGITSVAGPDGKPLRDPKGNLDRAMVLVAATQLENIVPALTGASVAIEQNRITASTPALNAVRAAQDALLAAKNTGADPTLFAKELRMSYLAENAALQQVYVGAIAALLPATNGTGPISVKGQTVAATDTLSILNAGAYARMVRGSFGLKGDQNTAEALLAKIGGKKAVGNWIAIWATDYARTYASALNNPQTPADVGTAIKATAEQIKQTANVVVQTTAR